MISPMNQLSKTLLITFIALCAALNQAQARTPHWYQIEVVIFAQPTNPSVTEVWRDTFAPDYATNAIILATDNAPIKSVNPGTEIEVEVGAFQSLPASQRKLTAAAKRIKGSADLRLLGHLAWRQPVPKDELAHPILIQTGQQFNNEFELEGTLTIRRGRYLHALTDLFFSRFEPMKSEKELDWTIFSDDDLEFGQREWNPRFNEAETAAAQFVRATTAHLKQSRRMRSGELHYIDHPLFGILVQITPYKLPDPAMDLQPFSLQSLPTQRPLPDSAISPNL